MSSILDHNKFRNELNINFEYLIYLIIPFIAVFMIVPDFFLKFFFSEEFLKMTYPLSLFLYLRLLESIYMFYLIAFFSQSRLKAFLVSELSKGISLIVISYFCIKYFKLEGAIISYLLMTIISFTVVLFFMIKDSIFRLNHKNGVLLIKILFIFSILLIPIKDNIVLEVIQKIVFVLLLFLIINIRKYFLIFKLFTKS